jgi:hypothetical protein
MTSIDVTLVSEVGRLARYDGFGQVMATLNAVALLSGHHLNEVSLEVLAMFSGNGLCIEVCLQQYASPK